MKKNLILTSLLATSFFAKAQWSGTNPLTTSSNVRIGGSTSPNQTFHVGDGTASLHNSSSQGMIIKFQGGDRALLELHSPDGANQFVLQALSGATYLGSYIDRPLYISGGTAPVTIGDNANGANKLEVRTASPSDGIRISQKSSGYGAAALHINNETPGGNNWSILSTGNGSSQGAGHFSIYDNNSNKDRFFIKNNGNIGINNTSPAFKLDIQASPTADGIQIRQPGNQANDYSVLFLNHTGGGHNWALYSAHNSDFGLVDQTSGNYALLTKGTSGNVGIGMVSAYNTIDARLMVTTPNTDDGILVNQIGSTKASLYLKHNSGGKQWAFQADASGNLFIKDILAGIDRLSVNASGNVGIGNTSPSQKLDVTGNMKFSGALMPNNTAGTAGQVLVSAGANQPPTWSNISGVLAGGTANYIPKWSGSSSQTSSQIYDNTTNVGIGTTSPGSKLEVRDNSGYGKISVYSPANAKSGLWALNAQTSYGLVVDGTVGHITNNINGPEFNLINFKQNIYSQPQVWIGSHKPQSPHADFNFAVEGKMVAQSLYITPPTTLNWADYVFASDYKLPKLTDVESYYKANRHLPEVPSAADVKEKGIDIAEMNVILLKKIEELTLYVVDQQKQLDALKAKAAK